MKHKSNDYFTTLLDALPTDHPGRKTWRKYLMRLHATVTGKKENFQIFMRNVATRLKTSELDVFLCDNGFEEATVPPLQAIRAPVPQPMTPVAVDNASENILPTNLNQVFNQECFSSDTPLNLFPAPRTTQMSSPELPLEHAKEKSTTSNVEDELQEDSEKENTPKNKDDETSSDSDSSWYDEDIMLVSSKRKTRTAIYSSPEKSSLGEDSEFESELDSPPKKLVPVRITKTKANGKQNTTREIAKPIRIKTKKIKESDEDIFLPVRIKKKDKVAKDLPIPIPIRRKKSAKDEVKDKQDLPIRVKKHKSAKDEVKDQQDLPIRVKKHNKEPSVILGDLEPIKIKKKKLNGNAVPLRVKKKQKYSDDQNAC